MEKIMWKKSSAGIDAFVPKNEPSTINAQDAGKLISSINNKSMPIKSEKFKSDFSKLETVVKEAGFDDVEETLLALQAHKNVLVGSKTNPRNQLRLHHSNITNKTNI